MNMSLTFAELNNIVDFNIKEWTKIVDNKVVIIKNKNIPEKLGELFSVISLMQTGEVLIRTTIKLMGKEFKYSKEKVFSDIEELQAYLRRLDNLNVLSLMQIEVDLVDAFDRSALELLR